MENKRIIALAGLLFLLAVNKGPAAEKIKFATAIKATPVYYLPVLAAEQKGIWKENGLEAEWVPFRAPVVMHRAVTAGSIEIGMDVFMVHIMGITRGMPTMVVSNLQTSMPARLWVLTKSPVKEISGLKGARIAVDSLGGLAHAYARLILRANGMEEKEVKFVGVGGIPEMMAALKSGAVEATGLFRFTMWGMEHKGEVRSIAGLEGTMWEPEIGHIIFARRELIKGRAQVAGRAIKAVMASLDFIRSNRLWAVEVMEKEQGLPRPAAQGMYDMIKFTRDGKISRQAMNNALGFLVEFGLVEAKSLPRLEELYTSQFTG